MALVVVMISNVIILHHDVIIVYHDVIILHHDVIIFWYAFLIANIIVGGINLKVPVSLTIWVEVNW